ncbi:DUF982 domain-containing protein [Mesorhizobium sp. M0306]|uniref:DUF982 domain-containing protein n=1 Tax=Mesorhizobium sp. M0306 TaxID=2956932 RepID=UPI003338C149
MATHWFSPPVYVKTDRPGVTYGCNNVESAAEELLKWTKMGPKWRKAVQLCADPFQDRVTSEEVRQASRLLPRRRGCSVSSRPVPMAMLGRTR